MGARGRVPAAKAERPLVAKLNRRNPQLYLADVLAPQPSSLLTHRWRGRDSNLRSPRLR